MDPLLTHLSLLSVNCRYDFLFQDFYFRLRIQALPPVLVFSDGACEEDGTSVGAVLFDPLSGKLQCFGAEISQSTLNTWKSRLEQTQVIGQAELFPLLVARLTWHKILAGRRCIFFLDNESARIAMIRAYSPVLCSLSIVMSCLKWDYENECVGWYARVPTASNPGDAPSRMQIPSMSRDVEVVTPIFPHRHDANVVFRGG